MSNRAPIRVLIADDHPVVREGLRLVLERRPDILVVAEVPDGREAVTRAINLRPDVAIRDLDMPELNGIAVIEELARTVPECRCLVLTSTRTTSPSSMRLRPERPVSWSKAPPVKTSSGLCAALPQVRSSSARRWRRGSRGQPRLPG